MREYSKEIRVCNCCGSKLANKKYWKYIIENDSSLKDVSTIKKKMFLDYLLHIFNNSAND